jgi:alcohol dehydrogenase class IV
MFSFDHFSVPRIVFGGGQIARVAELARLLGQRPLIIFNGPDELQARVGGLLKSAGIQSQALRQRREPTAQDVDAGVELARRESCDLLIGLGGGSAIDAAKATAGLLANGGAAFDYMEVVGRGLKITRPAIPWIAIPTTAGTGAEATRNAVISAPEHRFKASIRGEQLLARIALIDPQLQTGVAPPVTANSGMDALCQCIEAYTSIGSQPITDALALHGAALAARSLLRAYENGSDLIAREEMAMSALLSGIALTNAGLGAVHGLAAPLGANFPAPHGAVCAALLPHVIRANIVALREASASHPSLARYAAVGRALLADHRCDDDRAIAAAVEIPARLARDLRITSLRQFGVSEADVPNIIELARKSSSMRYNPVQLSDAALGEVLRLAI